MKKIFSLALMVAVMLNFTVTAFAAEESSVVSYNKVLAEINEEYGQEIGIESVDISQVSIEEFENIARSLAVQQKMLKEYVANRENYISNGIDLYSTTSVSKTVSKPSWQSDDYIITATYDVSGTRISNPRNIKIDVSGILYYICNHGYPVTDIIDSGRTLTVSAYGTVQGGGVTFTNIYVYTEFYYDS